MDVVVPFSPSHPKTRLSAALSASERREFAHVLLRDVLAALEATPSVGEGDVTVLSTAPLDEDVAVRVQLDERALTPAVNATLAAGVTGPAPSNRRGATDDEDDDDEDATPRESSATAGATSGVAIVMADLALATPETLERFLAADGDVVLAPGRGVGTNALVVRHPEFRVDFHGTSYLDHRENADAVDATVTVVDSHRLATDVDEPGDLAEVLAHGRGDAPDWLRDRGFELDSADGRVRARRHEH